MRRGRKARKKESGVAAAAAFAVIVVVVVVDVDDDDDDDGDGPQSAAEIPLSSGVELLYSSLSLSLGQQ